MMKRITYIVFSLLSLLNGVAVSSAVADTVDMSPIDGTDTVSSAAVQQRSITLDEAICLARTQSVDAAVALNQLKKAYWEYRTFRADFLTSSLFYLKNRLLLIINDLTL